MTRLDEIKARLETATLPCSLDDGVRFNLHSPTDIAFLLAEVERLGATVEDVRIACNEWLVENVPSHDVLKGICGIVAAYLRSTVADKEQA